MEFFRKLYFTLRKECLPRPADQLLPGTNRVTSCSSMIRLCGILLALCCVGLACGHGFADLECPSEMAFDDTSNRCVTPDPSNGHLPCAADETECGGQCVDLTNDRENCGDCGVYCGAGGICVNGSCELGCEAGLTECANSCADLTSDPENCGDCGVECGPDSICVNASCELDCEPGLTECDDSCVDLTSDPENCGDCGVECEADSICVNASCELDCAPGLTECGDSCVDTETDAEHCGDCHIACDVLHICESGSCEPVSHDPLTPIERDLYEAINDYRAEEGLAAIPLSYSLTFVARTHVQDLIDHGSVVLVGDCNLHSWSDQGSWTPCCYTPDHAEASCMWNKPRELTNYSGSGYEISTTAASSAQSALSSWQGSSAHRAVILNQGVWESMTWRAIGIGIDGGYSHVWFGTQADPDDW